MSAIDDYFESERARSSLGGVDLSGSGVRARAARGIRDMLRRLDTLPREDHYWDGTNRRPTLFKAGEYAGILVSRNAADEQAWWCLIGTSLWYCDNNFGTAGFKALHKLGVLDASWPVLAAYHVRQFSGFDPAELLARLIHALGIEGESGTALLALSRQDAFAKEWAREVEHEIERLHGRDSRRPSGSGQ